MVEHMFNIENVPGTIPGIFRERLSGGRQSETSDPMQFKAAFCVLILCLTVANRI